MRKLVLLSFVIVASLQFCGAQSLDAMVQRAGAMGD